MTIDVTLTSSIHNPWDGTVFNTDQLRFSYADLGFIPSTSDSYKSTSGDVFKVFVAGVRIYRSSDADYAGGTSLTGFLEDGDVANSKLNGISSVTWGSTSDAVWTIDTANQYVFLDQSAIAATALYGSSGKNVTFTSGTTIVELRRSVSDESTPSIDFSNASILTEQDLDNSSKNVFHLAQQAVVTADNSLPYNVGTSAYEAYQPGTTVKRKITQVADPVSDYDAVNKSFISTNLPNITTVAGIAGNVTTVAGDSASVTLLATGHDGTASTSGTTDNLVLVNTVAGKATEIGLLGTSAMATASTGHLARLGNATVTEDMALLGTAAVVEDMGLLGTTDCVADMAILGTSDVVTDMNVLATADVVTDMNVLGTADIVADMAILGSTTVTDDMALLAVPAVIDDMALLGATGVIADMDLLGATGVIADLATVTATGVIADIETVADNVAGVNSFADRYRVSSSVPTSSLDEGDLYYNTTDNNVRYYNGTAWTSVGQTEAQSIVTADNSATAMAIALG